MEKNYFTKSCMANREFETVSDLFCLEDSKSNHEPKYKPPIYYIYIYIYIYICIADMFPQSHCGDEEDGHIGLSL